MSRKYYEKVLAGSGTSSVKVKSAFGSKILAKYGWKDGEGLGATMTGISECVQVERRDERMGIGAEKKSESEWDNWWSGAYDSVAAKIQIRQKSALSETSTRSEEDEKETRKADKRRRKEEEEAANHMKRRIKRRAVVESDSVSN